MLATAWEKRRAYASQRAGSKRSASPSTRMPNSACPHGSSRSARGNTFGGSPARHRSSNSWAMRLQEVLLNQNSQFLACGFRNDFAVRNDGVRKGGAALAGACGRHGGNRGGHHLARVFGVLRQDGDDLV